MYGKKLGKMLVASMVVALLTMLAACGGNSNNNSNASGSNQTSNANGGGNTQQEEFSGIVPIYTPPTGNSLYILAAGLANLINQDNNILSNIRFSTESTSGDNGTLESLFKRYEQGRPAISTNTNSIVSLAYEGNYEVLPGEHKQIRAVANLGLNPIHLVVKKNSDIQTYADLKGRKIAGFAPGIGPQYLVSTLLSEHYNVQPDEYEMIPLGNEDRISSLIDGSVEASFLLGAPPSPLVTELARSTDIRLIPVEPEVMEEFTAKYAFYTSAVAPGNSYPGNEEDVLLPSIRIMMITHEDTPENIVYELVKTLIENPDKVKEMHKTFDITLENATIGTDVPFHPGAKKYYEEHGVTVQ